MKTLYESIWDPDFEPTKTNTADTSEIELMLDFAGMNKSYYNIDLNKGKLCFIKSLAGAIDLSDPLVSALKKIDINKIEVDIGPAWTITIYTKANGFEIESDNTLKLDFCETDHIKDMTIIAENSALTLRKVKELTNCSFKCYTLALGDPGYNSDTPIPKNCKIEAKRLMITLKNGQMGHILSGSIEDIKKSGYKFKTDPLKFTKIPQDVFKGIDEVVIQGAVGTEFYVITFTNIFFKTMDKTSDTSLKNCPWKYIDLYSTDFKYFKNR